MSLFEDYHIQDHACSKECYQIGQRLSVLGNVKSLNLTKKENDMFLITSRVEVKDGLRIPSALIMIRARKNMPKYAIVLASSCSCANGASPDHFCEHTVAMLTTLEDTCSIADAEEFLMTHRSGASQDWLESAPKYPLPKSRHFASSSLLLEAIDEVAKDNRNRLCQLDAHGDIELEPTLHIEESMEYIDFRIGTDSKYVVKDLYQLLHAINQQTFVTYGKKLAFTHTPSAFTPRSLKLIALLEKQDYSQRTAPFVYHKQYHDPRNLPADPAILDELLPLYEGKRLNIRTMMGNVIPTPVIRENPRIPVEICGHEEEAYVDFSIPPVLALDGRSCKYLFYQNCLYICSEDFSEKIARILPLMMHNLSPKERYAGGGFFYYDRAEDLKNLRLYRSDYQNFCATLLPIFTSCTKLQLRSINFDRYMIEEGTYDFYLDLDSQNNILCEAKATYGRHIHNLLQLPTLEETYRDIRAEYDLREMMKDYFTQRQDKYYVIPYDDLERQADFVENGIPKLQSLADLYASESFRKLRVSSQSRVHTGLSIKGNLLAVTWNTNEISDTELDGILQAYHKRKKYFRLQNGEILNLEQSGFGFLSNLQEDLNLTKAELRAGIAEVPTYRSLYLDLLMNENASRITVTKDAMFHDFMTRFDTIKDKSYPLPDIHATLRPYQLEGYHWACALQELGLGGILADDMGLGKTLQMLAYIAARPNRTHLVICPASLVYNWASECHRFTPDLKVLIVAGTANERQELLKTAADYDLIITSYDLLRRDIDAYQSLDIDTQIIDEAQNIKNPKTQAAKAVRSVPSKTRFALTGTPIENRLSELWSIFEYLLPGFFFSYDYFKTHFEEAIMTDTDLHDEALHRLQQLISPFVLRRLKTDVLTELPEKIEEVIYSKFDKKQEKLYRAHEKHAITAIGASDGSDKIQILAELMRLRQICCDPALLYDDYNGESAKLETCIELIKNGVEGGHKILLFSQFTSMLSIIENRLEELPVSYFKLTGETSKLKRRNLVEAFQRGEADVFLISLKAGGTGLNLTAADMVIHYDPWWNVAAQNQATDRSHRIGQEKTVTVFKLISSDTIEERILHLQEKKKDMADKIISADGMSLASLSKESLMLLFDFNEND